MGSYKDKNNGVSIREEDHKVTTLPGFRFHPTDEELVGFYLRRKVEKKALSIDQLIKQIDIYKHDPWDLPKVSNVGEREWYFFCMRGRKYRNSVRPNRVTGSGFWKATGIDKAIYSSKDPGQCVGLKKSLVYYRGSAGKGTKTDWMMHEFRLPPPPGKSNGKPNDTQEAEVWTVCRILKRIPSYKKYLPASKLETKPNPSVETNSYSKTCSMESDLSFGDTVIQQTERKPVLDHADHNVRSHNLFLEHHYNTVATETQIMASYPGFWNQDGDDFLGGENWDDLRSIVQRAVDPSQPCQNERTNG